MGLVEIITQMGIAAFSVSGALVGVRHRLDVFGVSVVGVVTGIGGGIVRDILLGITPPVSLSQWPPFMVALGASLAVFATHNWFVRHGTAEKIWDAFGLGLFAATGADYCLEHGTTQLAATLIGAIAAVGGGVFRDILVNDVPVLLQRELYAASALFGSASVAVAGTVGLQSTSGLIFGAAGATGLRLLSWWRGWNLPRAHSKN